MTFDGLHLGRPGTVLPCPIVAPYPSVTERTRGTSLTNRHSPVVQVSVKTREKGIEVYYVITSTVHPYKFSFEKHLRLSVGTFVKTGGNTSSGFKPTCHV